MTGAGSLGVRNQEVDFGTYHHSTPRESKKIRDEAGTSFRDTFDDLPFRP
jgi:hypothetical protein